MAADPTAGRAAAAVCAWEWAGAACSAICGGSSEHRFNLTFSVMITNVLNHVNPGGYVGSLNSPLFGQPTMVYTGFGGFGGGGTGADNRRVELQTRFTF